MLSRAVKLVVLMTLLLPSLFSFGKEDKENTVLSGTTSGRLKLDYESEKKAGKRYYRVRNTKGGILTPVLWKHKTETFIDATLPKWKEENCKWAETSIPSFDIDHGDTNLGYGVNQDQFVDMPDAFVRREKAAEKKAAEKKAKHPSLATQFKGEIVDAHENTIYVDLTVISTRGEEDGKGPGISYRFVIGKESKPISLEARPEDYNNRLRVIWESAESKEYKDRLSRSRDAVLTVREPEFGLSIRAPEVMVVEKKVILMQGSKKIASFSAPAYVPGRER